jgi:2-C-methyl-D-erythritol 4-phosphate cytidylyltransferase
MSSRIWAIVPAGGTGLRMNACIPKQYLQLGEHPIIEHTLRRLCCCDSVDQVVVGIAKGDSHWQQLAFNDAKLVAVINAGTDRAETVENCLQFIVEQGGEDDWALVHDAARPCVRVSEIIHLIDAVIGNADGGILAVPLSDTIKRGVAEGAENEILETVPRDDLWRAMTPQLFKVGELLSAIRMARVSGEKLTDEASAMEAAGVQVLLVPCSQDNIKITLPQDIPFAEMILRAQRQEMKPEVQ